MEDKGHKIFAVCKSVRQTKAKLKTRLTIGKTYEILDIHGVHNQAVRVNNDAGYTQSYRKEHFDISAKDEEILKLRAKEKEKIISTIKLMEMPKLDWSEKKLVLNDTTELRKRVYGRFDQESVQEFQDWLKEL